MEPTQIRFECLRLAVNLVPPEDILPLAQKFADFLDGKVEVKFELSSVD